MYAHLHTRKEMRCQSDLEARVLRRRAARRKNKCWLHSRFALRLEADGGATHFHTPLTNDGHRRPLLAGHSHSDPEKRAAAATSHSTVNIPLDMLMQRERRVGMKNQNCVSCWRVTRKTPATRMAAPLITFPTEGKEGLIGVFYALVRTRAFLQIRPPFSFSLDKHN